MRKQTILPQRNYPYLIPYSIQYLVTCKNQARSRKHPILVRLGLRLQLSRMFVILAIAGLPVRLFVVVPPHPAAGKGRQQLRLDCIPNQFRESAIAQPRPIPPLEVLEQQIGNALCGIFVDRSSHSHDS